MVVNMTAEIRKRVGFSEQYAKVLYLNFEMEDGTKQGAMSQSDYSDDIAGTLRMAADWIEQFDPKDPFGLGPKR